MNSPDKIRNIAIIAHVDHGKTTLVDFLLKQSNTFRAGSEEMGRDLIMDSNVLEKERGITILAKNTAVEYKGVKINIIDTPGHADFGGEVERTLNMADGALLLVDAQEGPMPQTKFVLKKALDLGLKIIVVINKIDKSGADAEKTLEEVHNLFLNLAEDASHLEFVTLYAIGREGKAFAALPTRAEMTREGNLEPLFEVILEQVPPPQNSPEGALQILVTSLDWDNYLGKYAIGRIMRGRAKTGQAVALVDERGVSGTGRLEKIFTYKGLKKVEVTEVAAGDIVAVTGLAEAHISKTIADAVNPEPLPAIKIEEPTLKITIGANTSPFMGKEGKFVTARQIEERLLRELEINVSLRMESLGDGTFLVSGRGELHLAILIENFRREGFEMQVSKPEVIFKEKDGVVLEPYEEVTIDVTEEYVGEVTAELGRRRGQLVNFVVHPNGLSRMVYHLPTRTILGLRNYLLTRTRGTAVLNTVFLHFSPKGEEVARSRNGVLVASEAGEAVAFGLEVAQGRGITFVGPQTPVYEGMIIGLNSRKEDIDINVCKEKVLSNMRSRGHNEAIQLTPPTILTLEQALDFIEDNELLEVTPQSLRLRKKILGKNQRR